MNREQLVTKIAEQTGTSKSATDKIVKAAMEEIKAAVAAGESVQLIGFGTFTSVKKTARVCRNPRTNKKIKVPAKTCPKFVAGKAFKEIVR